MTANILATVEHDGLTTANIPATVEHEGQTYTVTAIDDAFYNCTTLTQTARPYGKRFETGRCISCVRAESTRRSEFKCNRVSYLRKK